MKIAILGAESTGKTELAKTLVATLTGRQLSAVWLPEALREWCDRHGRTPLAHEQMAIAAEQVHRVDAAPPVDFLIADTTALTTAVYSEMLFDDARLYDYALKHHRSYDLTLVMGLDLAWMADGIQRDGPQTRNRVDARLRQVLNEHAVSYAVVYGWVRPAPSAPCRPLSTMVVIKNPLRLTEPRRSKAADRLPP